MRTMAGVAASLLLVAVPAAAQTGQPDAITINGSVTLASDYRFRGLSQSDRGPAVQGGIDVAHRSGVYVGGFVSTIGRYVADDADAEIDLSAGVRKTLGGTVLDGGLLYYVYPGASASAGDAFEPYVSASRTLGPVTARVGGNAAWRQRGLGLVAGERRAGLYAYGEVSAGIPTTPFTLTARVGRSLRANRRTFGERYTDWSLAATYTHRRLSATVAYVDTDRDVVSYPPAEPRRGIGGAGVLGSVTISF